MNREDFDYGWSSDPDLGRFAYAWHRSRDVAVVDFGGEYVEFTVAGSWQPGLPFYSAEAYEVANVRDMDGKRTLAFDPVALTGFFIASGHAG
jgi:hypothetical protein